MGSVVKCTLFWLHVIYIAFDCFHWFLLSGTYNIYLYFDHMKKALAEKKMQTLQKKSFGLVVFLKRENETGLHVRYQIGIWVQSCPTTWRVVATMLLKKRKTRKPLPAAGPSSPNIRYLWIKQVLKRLLSTTWFKKNLELQKVSLIYLCIYKIWKSLEKEKSS